VDYYPFGLNLTGLEKQGTPDHRYTYNGKEKQEEFGLDWHDYGARNYDPVLGRWHGLDPLTDSYVSFSPYHYSVNNPISNYDPDGNSAVAVMNEKKRTITIRANIYFYGDGSNSNLSNQIAGSIQSAINGAGSSIEIDGVTYKVKARIKGRHVSEKRARKLASKNGGNAENNFLRISNVVPDPTWKPSIFGISEYKPRSSKMTQGKNSGILFSSDIKSSPTTPIHEFFHGLGWNDPSIKDNAGTTFGTHDLLGDEIDGKRVPTISSPRNTRMDDPTNLGASSDFDEYYRLPGTNNVDPNKRRVTQRSINLIRLNPSDFKNSKKANIGSPNNQIYQENGKPLRN